MRIYIAAFGLALIAHAARADTAGAVPGQDGTVCQRGIVAAERHYTLPPKLLQTIGIVESGRADGVTGRVAPWPWTINVGGTGHFFETKAAAIEAVQTLQGAGVQSIDVGCMQINLMHHPDAFASLDDAFDPGSNALYGARFLSGLYRQTGNWPQAAAAYHSRTEDIGAAYETRVMAIWPLAAKFPDAGLHKAVAVEPPDPDMAGFTPELAARVRQSHAEVAQLEARSHLIVPVSALALNDGRRAVAGHVRRTGPARPIFIDRGGAAGSAQLLPAAQRLRGAG